MDRILILMDAPEYVDAQNAVQSARQNAAHPSALTFGFTFQEFPDEESNKAMEAFGALFIPMGTHSIWEEMERLWAGEEYVLMAHRAMRFTPGWDKALLRALRACQSGPVLTCALTGMLPVASDPMDAVCPVAADVFQHDGTLTFRRGMSLRYAAQPEAGPFLNPSFCFAPSGFFRALSHGGEEPLFLQAFRHGWELHTLHRPIIRLQWEAPVEPVVVPEGSDLEAGFSQSFGVSLTARTLSARSRRGLKRGDCKPPERYPLRLQFSERWRRFRYWFTHLLSRPSKKLTPHCITLVTPDMPEDTLIWLRQLGGMRNLPLMAYAPAQLKRQLVEFLPDVCDLQPQHSMELPGQELEKVLPLSKAAILCAARDRMLSPSHCIWIDPDCVRYPVFSQSFIEWEPICTDKIVLAMVNGQPDTSMISVPERMVLLLASDLQARALAILNQRGTLPDEAELWTAVIREKPDWFALEVMPERGQLFTLICKA